MNIAYMSGTTDTEENSIEISTELSVAIDTGITEVTGTWGMSAGYSHSKSFEK